MKRRVLQILSAAFLLIVSLSEGKAAPPELRFESSCSQEIRYAIHYQEYPSGDWETEGWFTLAPGDSADWTIWTENPVFYYTAHSPGTNWFGTDLFETVDHAEIRYGFREKQLNADRERLTLNLSCEAPPPHQARVVACENGIHAAIRHRRNDNRWLTRGFFPLDAYRVTALTDVFGSDFFLHGGRQDGSSQLIWGDEQVFGFGGRDLRFGNIQVSDPWAVTMLYC